MSGGHREGQLALALVIGITAPIFFAFYHDPTVAWFLEKTHSNEYSYYAKHCAAQNGWESYRQRPALSLDEPLSDNTGSAEEGSDEGGSKQPPDWCDLAAQQSMADSTFYMMLAGWLAFVLSIVGVGLLWRTLYFTRETLRQAEATTKAALETADAAREQLAFSQKLGRIEGGAYLRFRQGTLTEKGRDSYYIDVTVENISKSPATNARIHGAHVRVRNSEGTLIGLTEKVASDSAALAPGAQESLKIITQPSENMPDVDYWEIVDGGHNAEIEIDVFWDDLLENRHAMKMFFRVVVVGFDHPQDRRLELEAQNSYYRTRDA